MNKRSLLSVAGLGLVLGAASASAIATQATAAAGHSANTVKAAQMSSADAVFHALDTDKNGTLSAQEFQVGYARMQQVLAVETRMHEQFRLLDTDHNGSINAAEYANLLLVKRAGRSAPPMSAFDANKDGALDFAEYLIAVRRLAAQLPTAPAAPRK